MNLTRESQLVLIKLGFFELLLLQLFRLLDARMNTLTFHDGSSVHRYELNILLKVR